MSTKNPGSKPDSSGPEKGAKGSWRGKGQSGQEKVAQHRWQKDWTKEQDSVRVQSNRMHRFKIFTLLLLGLGLTGMFVYYLLWSPAKTPFIAVSVTQYEWPLPPNAWATEDVETFGALNNQSLEWTNLSSHWSSAELGLKHLDQELAKIVKIGAKRPAIIIYLSMHGVVNRDGKACLLTPGVSPLDESSWLTLQSVLERIKQQGLPDSLYKVLILDCNRIDVNWNIGVLQNGFAAALEDEVRAADISRLAVLNSTSPGQIGWASPELHSSVFAHYLFSGIQGPADANADGKVSIHELHKYLKRQVSQWASENRADQQTPMLVYSGAEDFEVAWALRKGWFSKTVDAKPKPVVSDAVNKEISALWHRHDEILAQKPTRFAPLEWRDFEHQLLQLELLVQAGSAYENRAKAMLNDLTKKAAGMHFGEVSAHLPAHSLPLAYHMGRALGGPEEYPTRVATAWDNAQRASSRQALQQSVANIGQPNIGFEPGVVEGQFLTMLDRHLDSAVWTQDPGAVSTAIRMRDLAERVAADSKLTEDNPRRPDERVQYWIRTTVDAGDQSLRKAEDSLFIGDSDSLAHAQKMWADAQKRYERSRSLANTIAASLELRDQAWAEVPYLAEWLCRRFPAGQKSEQAAADAQIKREMLKLIEDIHAFANHLDSSLPTSVLDHEPPPEELEKAQRDLQTRASKLRTEFDKLRNEFDKKCKALVTTSGGDQGTLREIASALAIPLVRADDRTRLRTAYLELAKKIYSQQEGLSARAAGGTGGGKEQAADSDDQASSRLYESRINSWGAHPASILVEPAAPSDAKRPGPKESLARQGAWVRDVLADVPGEISSVNKKLDNLENPNELEIRAVYNRVDRMSRAVGALAPDTPRPEPAELLRRLDLRHLLLWHSRRTMEDFWGPSESEGTPFFDDVAAGYLKSAKTVWQTDTGVRRQFEAELDLLKRRRDAALNGLQPDTQSLVLTGEEVEVPHSITPRVDPQVPPGQAAFFIYDPKAKAGIPLTFGNQGRLRRIGLDVPTASVNPLNYTLRVGEWQSDSLDAIGLYRGHRYKRPFAVPKEQGVEVVYERILPGPPRLTVKGQATKQGSVVLILDCSYSMNAAAAVENGVDVSRMRIATLAFESLLEGIAQASNYRVGVFFYGHRAGWNLKKQGEVLHQKGFINPIPAGLKPYEDVERILPLGRFGAPEKAVVANALNTIKAWGETPLYYSINEALKEFKDDGSQQSIIAITDGKNNVFNPPTDKIVNMRDLLKAHNQRPIAIHVVSFQLSPDERNEATGEFTTITKATGGKYFEAKSATELAVFLQATLGPNQYTVFNEEGVEVASEKIHKGVEIVPRPEKKTRFTVQVATRDSKIDTKVDLEGGEGLEIFISRDGRRLEHQRYEEGRPVFTDTPITDPLGSGQFIVGAHRPVWTILPMQDQPIVRFPISLQNADEKLFTPRPAEAWVDITPRFADRTREAPKYSFYDINYELDRPVPVLSYPIPGWPRDARKADVNVVWKLDKTEPDTEVKVGTALEQPTSENRISGAQKLTYKLYLKRGDAPGTQRVGVILSGQNVEDIRVAMDPPAQTSRHRVDTKLGLAIHNFDYPGVDENELRNYRAQFTTRESLLKNSLQMKEPLQVDIPDPNDIIK